MKIKRNEDAEQTICRTGHPFLVSEPSRLIQSAKIHLCTELALEAKKSASSFPVGKENNLINQLTELEDQNKWSNV